MIELSTGATKLLCCPHFRWNNPRVIHSEKGICPPVIRRIYPHLCKTMWITFLVRNVDFGRVEVFHVLFFTCVVQQNCAHRPKSTVFSGRAEKCQNRCLSAIVVDSSAASFEGRCREADSTNSFVHHNRADRRKTAVFQMNPKNSRNRSLNAILLNARKAR